MKITVRNDEMKITVQKLAFATGIFMGTLSNLDESPEVSEWLKERGYMLENLRALDEELRKLSSAFYQDKK